MVYNKENISVIEDRIEMYCSRSEQCRFSVRKKLQSWHVPDTEIARILENLEDERFIDEQRYASAFTNDKVKFGHCGKQKIRFELKQHGIPDSCIRKALEEIPEELYVRIMEEVALSKWEKLSAEENVFVRRQKLSAFLLSRGFEMDRIIVLEKNLEG